MAKEEFYSAVYLIIKDDNGNILLQRRQGSKLWPNFLALPAGHIDKGELSKEAAIREAYEELGIEIEEKDLIFKYVLCRKNKSLKSYFDIFFEVKKYKNKIRIAEPEKCTELKWVNPSNLPDDMITYEIEVLNEIADGNIYGETLADNEEKLSRHL
jgi:mutator protein MutT